MLRVRPREAVIFCGLPRRSPAAAGRRRVAGSFCRGPIAVAGLLTAVGLAHGQMVEVSSAEKAKSPGHPTEDSQVTIVTQTHLTKQAGRRRATRRIGDPSISVVTDAIRNGKRAGAQVTVVTDSTRNRKRPGAQVNIITQATGPISQRTVAQVVVVTESNQSEQNEPAPAMALSRNLAVAQVTIVTESNAAEESQPPLPPSEFNPDPGATLREENRKRRRRNCFRRFCRSCRSTARKRCRVRSNFRAKVCAKSCRNAESWNTKTIPNPKPAKVCFPLRSQCRIDGSSDSAAGNVMPILPPRRPINPTCISGIPICRASSKATRRSSARTFFSTHR